jgi:hypothetical protein
MAKEKGNKALYIGIGVVAVIAVVVGIIIAVTRGSGNNNEGDGTNQSTVYTAGDFTPIQQSIEFGDYNTMFSLTKEIQNGEAIGKIVEIDGYVSHPGSKYSIVQKNSDGTKSIGTEFVIEGDSAIYPQDGEHIVLVGKVVEREPLYYNLATIQELVSVVND